MSVSLHVIDEGAGPAVVLLHGFPDSSALWRHQIPILVEAGYRVIAPDLRGFGPSDRPAGRFRPSPAPCWASPPTATSRAGRRR
jgi:pimeloyl-ACP methyl ester carboxylesterase